MLCQLSEYVRVSECVCVWNIWIDVKLLIRIVTAGGRSVMVSLLPTKTLTIDGDTRLGQSGVPALLWSPVVQGLLRIFIFILQSLLVNGIRLSLQPDPHFWLRVRLPQSALWIYSTGSSFSPFQNSLLHHWWVFRRWSLFYLSRLHLENSDDYFEEDSLVSKTSLIMFAWDSVPYRSYDGSIFV